MVLRHVGRFVKRGPAGLSILLSLPSVSRAAAPEPAAPPGSEQARETVIQGPGGKIWTCVFGKEKPGIPLLVLHGGPGFLSLTRELAELSTMRPVYFYDQLGCGRSERPAGMSKYTVDYYVRELAAVRKKLGLDKVHILGQSWGCMLAAEYILRERPRGVKSLILSGPLLSTPRWEADQRTNLSRMPEEVRRAVEEAEKVGEYGKEYQEAMMAYYKKHVCRLEPWPDYLTDALGKLNTDVYLTMWGPSEFTTTGTLRSADLTERLKEIQVPVLLICGEYDEAGVETVKHFRDLLPDGALAVIPRASHCHMLEQPEIFRAIVNAFLDDVEKEK
ncbi:MAG: proline iminopeptidase-family hydrolase [PVC group bacterium]